MRFFNFGKKTTGFFVFVLAFVALTIFLPPISRASAADLPTKEKKTVTVGFFEFDGYHNIDSNGNKSGYGYDFIQMIKHYNNWNVSYTGYNKSWAEALKMLENEEIDILTSARKTPERENLFDFSEQIGYSTTLLTVRAGDSRYVVGDTSTYNGIRIGMIENNTRNDSFNDFAIKNGISYTQVIYKSVDEMVQALQTGDDVDAIVTSSLRSIKNETVLEEFDSSPFYAIVKKGNTELLSEINYAISLLNIRNAMTFWIYRLSKAEK